jgi:neutral ceramidase
MNRRRAHADGTFGGPDPDGPVDHDVDVIRLDTANGGATKAVLVHYACHPVVTADRRVGPDFPGAVRTQLSRRLGNGAVIAFLQGCCGDINPALVRDGGFYRGETADVEKLGGELATAAAATLEAGLDPCGAPVLTTRSTLARLPLHPPSRDTLARRRNEDGIWGDWCRHLWAHPDQVVEEVPLRLTLVELTDDLALLGFDAEMTVAYGHFVKSRSETRRVLPLGYTNGMIGYVVTAQQVREGGYEPEGSYPYIYRPGPFTAGAEQVVKSAVDALLADTQVAAAATGGRP